MVQVGGKGVLHLLRGYATVSNAYIMRLIASTLRFEVLQLPPTD